MSRICRQVDKQDSMWEGECFVFDHRISSSHNMQDGDYGICYSCRVPITAKDHESDKFEYGVSCPRCYDQMTDKKRSRMRERQKQITLIKQRGTKANIGDDYYNSIYYRAVTDRA